MGMSSSQARLLNLTSRMHQIEYKAAKLEAQKLQMANKSAHVYETYLDALESTKIQQKKLNPDGSIGFEDATYQKVLDNGYFVQFLSTGEMWGKNGRIEEGKITISQADKDRYDSVAGNRNYFIALSNNRINAAGYNAADGVYEIYTAAQLNNMTSSYNYRLMSDISMAGVSYSSKILGNGKTFDGNGHSITGLSNALFSTAYTNATIKNLSVQGNVSSASILLNSTSSSGVTICDVAVSGSITAGSTSNVGAVVGSMTGSKCKIERCTSDTAVTGHTNVGGIVGYIKGSSTNRNIIEDCYVTKSETGDSKVGGIAGCCEYTNVSNCITDSTAKGTHDDYPNSFGCDVVVGGLMGKAVSSKISFCETRGNVISATSLGGSMFGYISNGSEASNLNGRANVTFNANGSMTDPNNGGSLMGAFMGGILNSEVKDSNFTGTINVNGYTGVVGAFIGGSTDGAHDTSSVVTNCYTSASGPFAKTDSLSYTESSTQIVNNISVTQPNIATTTQLSDPGNYGYMFDMIAAGNYVVGTAADPTDSHQNDTTWFTNMLNAGEIFICEQDKDGKYFQTSVATNTNFQEINDDSKLRKAEAQYEADMRKIDAKDRKYDAELAALDTERNAVKSEMETLKTVARENVERTFKLFS